MKRFALLLVCLALVVSGTGCCCWNPCGGGYGAQYGGACSPCQGGCGYGTNYAPTYSPYGTPTTYYGGGQIAAYPYPTVTAGVPLQAVPQ